MAVHNQEGKLFDAVFHKLLALGVVVISAAALVWLVWAVVRACEITDEASQPATGSSMHRAPAQKPPLTQGRAANSDAATPAAQLAASGRLIKLCFGPAALIAARIDRCFDRLPRAVAVAAEDAAFFRGGPS